MRIPIVGSRKEDAPIDWWEWLFLPVVIPLAFAVLFVVAVCSIPVVWLYPERCAHQLDIEGTPDQQQRLRNYRQYRRNISLGRRLLEKARIVPFDRGPENFEL